MHNGTFPPSCRTIHPPASAGSSDRALRALAPLEWPRVDCIELPSSAPGAHACTRPSPQPRQRRCLFPGGSSRIALAAALPPAPRGVPPDIVACGTCVRRAGGARASALTRACMPPSPHAAATARMWLTTDLADDRLPCWERVWPVLHGTRNTSRTCMSAAEETDTGAHTGAPASAGPCAGSAAAHGVLKHQARWGILWLCWAGGEGGSGCAGGARGETLGDTAAGAVSRVAGPTMNSLGSCAAPASRQELRGPPAPGSARVSAAGERVAAAHWEVQLCPAPRLSGKERRSWSAAGAVRSTRPSARS